MRVLGTGRPNIRALTRREDVHALAEAAAYRERSLGLGERGADAGAPVREEAVLALGALGPGAGNGTVSHALRDPAERVRVAAVRVLHARGQTDDLIEALGWLPTDGPARRLVVHALLVGKPRGTARAVACTLAGAEREAPLTDADFALLDTLIAAEENPDVANDVVAGLLAALGDDRDTVCDRAEELLLRLAPASTQGVIAELQGGPSPRRAASVLGRMGDSRALEPLVASLQHRDPRVRGECATALGRLRDTAAVEPLLGATRDPDHFVRASAGSALDQLGTAAVVLGMSSLIGPAIRDAVTAATRHALQEPPPPTSTAKPGTLQAALQAAAGRPKRN